MNADKGKILSFRQPSPKLLSRVEAESRSLRIPTYKEALGPYYRQYVAYGRSLGSVAICDEIDRVWADIKTKHPAIAEDLEKWRNAILSPVHRRQEACWEEAAYELGMFIARREFPRRLTGGVL